ncbi:MAG: bifunctional alpha,alpha-trehalose-phosphate synthase (UDP-forming)/trehalose-phosphatase [Spirochaetota bacterium]
MALVIVSNRLPFEIRPGDKPETIRQSAGGVATGIYSYISSQQASNPNFSALWAGWPGPVAEADLKHFADFFAGRYLPVPLNAQQMEMFYDGFCNKTLWPLFHSFPMLTEFDDEYWQHYVAVNRVYCERLVEELQDEDTLFVNDYHLMLLPAMVKQKLPALRVCFFLHIPFPDFEIFRLLPGKWRSGILQGLTAADVVGFHTHEYREYFLRCVRRILGKEHTLGEIITSQGRCRAEAFPMGIDFDRYAGVLTTGAPGERTTLLQTRGHPRRILSIDRLDYTKGILNRLRGFELFLRQHPEMAGQVQLHVVAVPSRIGVGAYQNLRTQLDELVGHINGMHSRDGWAPIFYQFTTLTTEQVILLYRESDIALVTPLRDGMNLIAKEYLAARTDGTGVLILSEMAGAASELPGAIIINPNSYSEIAEAIWQALHLKVEEQQTRNEPMRQYLRKQNIHTWMGEIMEFLDSVQISEVRDRERRLAGDPLKRLLNDFLTARNPAIFLDYDGTLVDFAVRPEAAVPDAALLELLGELCSIARVAVVSGRNRNFLARQLDALPLELIAEHGVFYRPREVKDWSVHLRVQTEWIPGVLPIFEKFASRIYGSQVESKESSLVFHYRAALGEPELIRERVLELYETLLQFTSNLNTQVLRGSYNVEMRSNGVNKGSALLALPGIAGHDFILAIGDDTTDEDTFRLMPGSAYTVKVGREKSLARYYVTDVAAVRDLLTDLSGCRRS